MKWGLPTLAFLFVPVIGQELEEGIPPELFFSIWPESTELTQDLFELPPLPAKPTVKEIVQTMVPPEPDTSFWFSHKEANDPTIDENAWSETILPPLDTNTRSLTSDWETDEPSDQYRKIFLPFKLPSPATLLPLRAVPVPKHRYRTVEYLGNTALEADAFRSISTSLIEHPLDEDDLAVARDLVTQTYLKRGFLNSGAIETIPNPDTGTLVFKIQEGSLAEFNILNKSKRPRLNESYLVNRLQRNSFPLQIEELRQSLQILQLNPNIQRLNAELKPGSKLGEALLEIELEEKEHQWSWGTEFHNSRPVTVGAEQWDAWIKTTNLTGVSDSLEIRTGLLAGGVEEEEIAPWKNFSLSYSRPLFPNDTSIEFAFSRQDYTLIQEPFESLDIAGETNRFSFLLKKPITQNLTDTITLRSGLEHLRSRTSLLGEPFSLSPGFVDGELDLTTVQVGASWLRRQSDSVLALDTALHGGLEFLGSTESNFEPDTSFLTWTSNAQYLKRIGENGDRLQLRGGAQLAFDSLPASRQFTLGGLSSVRGYRPNHLVSDSGFFLGAEYHHLLPRIEKMPELSLELVPFIDVGHGWNHEGGDSETLFSAGLGLTANYQDWLQASLFYGYALTTKAEDPTELSEHGFHLNLSIARF